MKPIGILIGCGFAAWAASNDTFLIRNADVYRQVYGPAGTAETQTGPARSDGNRPVDGESLRPAGTEVSR